MEGKQYMQQEETPVETVPEEHESMIVTKQGVFQKKHKPIKPFLKQDPEDANTDRTVLDTTALGWFKKQPKKDK